MNKKIISVFGLPTNEFDIRDFKNEREPVMEVTLRLSNNCNFKCEYCSYYDNSHKPNNIEFMKVIINQIIETYKNYTKIVYYFHGGEPTIYPYFVELVEYIDQVHKSLDFSYKIEVQTNSTKIKANFFKALIGKNIYFVCSYQQHQNKIETFKTFINYCIEYKMLSGVDLILEEFETTDYNEIVNLYKWLEELKNETNGKYSIQTNTVDGKDTPKEYQEIMNASKDKESLLITYNDSSTEKVNLDKFVSEQRNNFLFFNCNVGLNSIIIDTTINNEVSVYKCFSDILYNKNKPNIKLIDSDIKNLSEKLKKLIKPNRCLYRKCVCEIQVPKWK